MRPPPDRARQLMLRGAIIAAVAYWAAFLLELAFGEDLGVGPLSIAGLVWGGFTFLVGLGYWLRGADEPGH